MISLTTKAYLQENRTINFKIPETIDLMKEEYELVIVINTTPLQKTQKRKLTFAEHQYNFDNQVSTFSREEIYGDYGR